MKSLMIAVCLIFLSFGNVFASSAAPAPELTRGMKFQICSAVAYDYHDYDGELDEESCLASKFEVTDFLFNEQLQTYMQINVRFSDDMDKCDMTIEKVISHRGARSEEYWLVADYKCD